MYTILYILFFIFLAFTWGWRGRKIISVLAVSKLSSSIESSFWTVKQTFQSLDEYLNLLITFVVNAERSDASKNDPNDPREWDG